MPGKGEGGERVRERATQFHAISDEGRKKRLYRVQGGVRELISNNDRVGVRVVRRYV